MEPTKKELAWPLGIIIAYLIFISGTLFFVFLAFKTDVDLVAADYYQKTLKYQDQIEREANALSLAEPLRWELEGADLVVRFPEELLEAGVSGEITMYRPSDENLDFRVQVAVDETGVQRIPAANLRRGLWKMQVLWNSAGTEYYISKEVYLR